MKLLRIKVPAQTANLGPGFDCLALALNFYNELVVEKANGFHYDCTGYRTDGELVRQAICKGYTLCKNTFTGARVQAVNRIPPGRGLGSSAAAVVCGLAAGILLGGGRLCREELLQTAWEMEGHADNAAAALYGGFIAVIERWGEAHAVKMDVSPGWYCIVGIPELHCATKEARAVLPEKIRIDDAVHNLGRVAVLVSSLIAGDDRYLLDIDSDRLHQPFRIRHGAINEALQAARQAGAPFAVVSGSGPSVMALARENGEKIGRAIVSAYEQWGIKAVFKVLKPERRGLQIKEEVK